MFERVALWVMLTMVLLLLMIGIVAGTNYGKVSGGTCGSKGGQWVYQGNQIVCYTKNYINDAETR